MISSPSHISTVYHSSSLQITSFIASSDIPNDGVTNSNRNYTVNDSNNDTTNNIDNSNNDNINTDVTDHSSDNNETNTLNNSVRVPTPLVNWQFTNEGGLFDEEGEKCSWWKCTMCTAEYSVAVARCVECDDMMCYECLLAHKRVRMTRGHKVVLHVNMNKQWDLNRACESFSSRRIAVTNGMCAEHNKPLICQCTVCSDVSLCYLCITNHSKHHQLTALSDMHTSIVFLINGSVQYQKDVEDAIKTVQLMNERVKQSVQSIKNELNFIFDIYMGALEDRKRDLMQRLETIEQTKIRVLEEQREHLEWQLTTLSDAFKTAQAVVSSSSSINDDRHLHAMFNSLLSVLRGQNVHLLPHESDHLKFIVPESALLRHQLRNFGELQSSACAQQTHLIGDSHARGIQNRINTIQVQLRDACADQCHSTINHAITVQITAADGTPSEVHIEERERGICSISYYPTIEGMHMLDIRIRGLSISGCPSNIYVRKGRNYADLMRRGPLFSFGGEGSGDGQLSRPWGICCDHKDRILIADRSNHRIQIFDKSGTFLMKFGLGGVGPGEFNRPTGIAVNSKDNIVVADKDNHRIQVFDERGKFLFMFGEKGRALSMFRYPWGVAVNAFDQIAVSDTRNRRVQIFSPRGRYLRKIGFDSSLLHTKLESPRGVCFLSDGRLIISDFNSHRLAVVSDGGGNEMRLYGSEGDGNGHFSRPQGIAVDDEGHILVCDTKNNRIQVVNVEDMRSIATFGGIIPPSHHNDCSTSTTQSITAMHSSSPNTIISNLSSSSSSSTANLYLPTQSATQPFHTIITLLDKPNDLCVSPDGLIYVVDFGNCCVRVY